MRDHSAKGIACISFDLDDTLWDCKPVIQRAEQRFYQWLTEHEADFTRRYSLQAMLDHRIAYMRQNAALMYDLTRLRKAWLRDLATQEGLHQERLVEEGFTVFWEARNDVTLYDHVESTLTTLGQHYKIAAISNGNASVARIGIDHLFDVVMSSEQAGVAKPDTSIFHQTAELAGVSPEQMLHVGDDITRDVEGALQAGCRAVWVKGRTSKAKALRHPPERVVTHVRELLDYLL